MVKTLTDKFKTGKRKGGKLDLVTAVNGKNYETKFNEIYSGIQSDREKYERLLNRYSDGDILKQEKKNYGFGKSVKRGLATLTAIAGLTLIGCPSPVGNPSDYEEPTKPANPDNPDKPNPVEPIPDTDYVDISGRLQDNETDQGNKPGYIIVKDKSNNSEIGRYNIDGTNDGYFAFSLPKKVSELPQGIILEARLGTEGNETSYKRIIELPAGDHNPITDPRGNPAIRVVPYDGVLNVVRREADFKEHMRRVNFGDQVYVTPAPNPGSAYLKKWNQGEVSESQGHPVFKGIEINSDCVDEDPSPTEKRDGFTELEYDAIVSAIRNSGHVNASTIPIAPYGTNSHQGAEGWGNIRHISKSPNGSPATITYDLTQDGNIDSYIVYTNLEPRTINHEDEHGISSLGHASEAEWDEDKKEYVYVYKKLFDSLMVYSADEDNLNPSDENYSKLRSVDIKANYIVDEPTYLGMEKLDDILGQ